MAFNVLLSLGFKMSISCQNVIDKVSADIRTQLSSSVAADGQTILIDYVDRIQKQILRWSNWEFMISNPFFFLTHKGQTDYWIGKSATFTLTAAANSVSGATIYTGTGIDPNTPVDTQVVVAGFTNSANNGTFK